MCHFFRSKCYFNLLPWWRLTFVWWHSSCFSSIEGRFLSVKAIGLAGGVVSGVVLGKIYGLRAGYTAAGLKDDMENLWLLD